jgi:hypothetical protein
MNLGSLFVVPFCMEDDVARSTRSSFEIQVRNCTKVCLMHMDDSPLEDERLISGSESAMDWA